MIHSKNSNKALDLGQSKLCYLDSFCKNRKDGSMGSNKKRKLKSQRGQLVFEYILLLLVAVSMATIMRNTLTASTGNPEDSGVFVKMWIKVVRAIGEDRPVNPE